MGFNEEIVIVAVIVIIIALASVVIPLLMVINKKKKTEKFIRKIAEAFDGTLSSEFGTMGGKFHTTYNEHKFEVKYTPPAKNTPSCLTISLKKDFGEYMSIRKENWFDKFGSQIGLVQKIRTNDSVFDDKFFIETNNRILSGQIMDEKHKLLVTDLFNKNVNRITLNGDSLTIIAPGIKLEEINQEMIKTYFEQMAEFSKGYFSPGFKIAKNELTTNKIMTLTLIPTGIMLLIGIIFLVMGWGFYEPLLNPFFYLMNKILPYTAILTGVYIFFVFAFVKNRYDTHNIIAANLGLAILGFGFLLTGYIIFSNGYLDKSPKEKNIGKVIKKTKSSKSKTVYIYLPAFDDTATLSPSSTFFNSVDKGDKILITHVTHEYIIS